MKWFIDTEYDGLILISIGMVREDGKPFYATSADFDPALCNPWVKEHVLPHLTGVPVPDTRANIAKAIAACIEEDGEPPTFYGWYSAYDWVLFCELFGGMLNLPMGWPQICIDLRQELERYPALMKTRSGFPPKPVHAHDALEDAKWHVEIYRWLKRNAIGQRTK